MSKLVALLQGWGPFGAFLLAILDSSGVPLPASVDVLLVAVGAVSPGSAMWAAAASVAGSLLGCFFLFSVARKGGELYLERHASSPSAMRFRAWFARYGLSTVFVPALIPIIPLPLKVFVLSAGALGVPARRYLAVVLAARLPRYFGLAWLGAYFGDGAWPWLKAHAWHLGGLAVLIFAAMFLFERFGARAETAG